MTGHTGFKGSWLSAWLLELGATVRGYALAPEDELNHFDGLKLAERMDHIVGDVRDLPRLTATMQEFAPDVVIHLAAQALVRRSYKDPVTTYETNVMGGVNLLEAVRATPSIRSLVFITSDKAYKNKEWVWSYRETDELGGHEPYSASKAAAELVCQSYYDSFLREREDLGVATTRAGNVVGGGDWSADRIVPDCIRGLSTKGVVQIRSPNATRPWQHVLEPLSGYLLLATRLLEAPKRLSGAYNFGPQTARAYTVLEVVESLIREWGEGRVEVQGEQKKVHEAGLLQLSSEKAQHALDWRTRLDFEQTMAFVAHWYRDHKQGQSVSDITRGQIAQYEQLG